MSKAKSPALWFYGGDWKRDAGLQSCSLAARGLWLEMLLIMRDCEPFGTLAIHGRPLSENHLARMAGADLEETTRLLQELGAAKVYSRDADGTIYSRRLRREYQQRVNKEKAGKASADSVLALSSVNRQSTELQQKPKRSADAEAVVVAVSFGFEKETAIPENLDVPAFRELLAEWFEYRRERGLSAWALRTIKAKLEQLSEWGLDLSLRAIRESIANGWHGIFPPRFDTRRSVPRMPEATAPLPPPTVEQVRDWLSGLLDSSRLAKGDADAVALGLQIANTVDDCMAVLSNLGLTINGDEIVRKRVAS